MEVIGLSNTRVPESSPDVKIGGFFNLLSTREDLEWDAYLDKAAENITGYHKGCGGQVHRHVSLGRRYDGAPFAEPDEEDVTCDRCGEELGDEDVCQDEYEAQTGLSTADLATLKPQQEPIEKCVCGGVRWSVTEWLEQECGGEMQRVRRDITGCAGCSWPEG